jgi:O-antigen ligase
MLVPLTILGAVLLPAFLIAIDRQAAAGAVLVFLCYTRISEIGVAGHSVADIGTPGAMTLGQAPFALIALLVFMWRSRTGGSRSITSWPGAWVAIAAYVAVVCASTIWATEGNAARWQAIGLAKNCLLTYMIAELLATHRAARGALWALIIGGSLLSLLSIGQAVTQSWSRTFYGLAQAPLTGVVGSVQRHRPAGPVGDPNYYALFLAMVVPAALLLGRAEERRGLRWLAFAGAMAMTVATVLTYSRGGFVAFAVGLLFLAASGRVGAKRIAATILIAVALFPLLPREYWDRLVAGVRIDHSMRARMASLEIAGDMFVDYPIGGVGADNYRFTFLPYALRRHVPDAASTVHDVYLAIAAETGILGAGAFGALIAAILNALVLTRRRAARVGDTDAEVFALATLAAFAVYLSGALFLPIAYPRYLWLLIGLALGLTSTELADAPDRRSPFPAASTS